MKISKSINWYEVVGIAAVLFALLGFMRAEATRVDLLEYKVETKAATLVKIDERLSSIDKTLISISKEMEYRRGLRERGAD